MDFHGRMRKQYLEPKKLEIVFVDSVILILLHKYFALLGQDFDINLYYFILFQYLKIQSKKG
jgi:hypothetical protein